MYARAVATKVLSVRASEEEIEQWRLAASEQGVSLATWMHDVVAEVAAGMGFRPGAVVIDGQTHLWSEEQLEPRDPSVDPAVYKDPAPEVAPTPLPPAPVIPPVLLPPEQGGRPPVEAGVSTLKPTCQAAHLHWRLSPNETCLFCGGQP